MTDNLPSYIDFANHHPNATEADIKYICDKVTEHGFNSAFMNPSWVMVARQNLGYTGKIGTIVSFSLGQDSLDTKIFAAKQYAAQGANELDVMANVSYIKEGKWDKVEYEIKTFVQELKATTPATILKIVPECGYLNPDEIKKVAEIMVVAGVDFFKTCTGMGPRGANLEDVKYIKEAVGDQIKIKVAGGVDTPEEAEGYIQAGVVRMGTSKALEIIGAKAPAESSNTQSE